MSRNDQLVAVVTGGSRGIGKGVARALAERGATVSGAEGSLLPAIYPSMTRYVNSLSGSVRKADI